MVLKYEIYSNKCFDQLSLDFYDYSFVNDNKAITPTEVFAQIHIAYSYCDSNTYKPEFVDFAEARVQFQKLVDKYPNCYLAPFSAWKIAELFNAEHKRNEAIAAFDAFIDKYPQEIRLIVQAYEQIGAMLVAMGDIPRLDQYAIKLAQNYSSTDYLFESLFEGFPKRWYHSITVGIANNIPENKRTIITDAINEWKDNSNNTYEIIYVINAKPKFMPGPGTEVDIYIELDDNCFGGAGATQLGGIIYNDHEELTSAHIYLKTTLDDINLRKVALHEFGHALGLGHSFNRHDIMTNSGTTTSNYLGNGQLTQRDIKTAQLIYTTNSYSAKNMFMIPTMKYFEKQQSTSDKSFKKIIY